MAIWIDFDTLSLFLLIYKNKSKRRDKIFTEEVTETHGDPRTKFLNFSSSSFSFFIFGMI